MTPFLNYHHLRYFRAVASDGNLTRAAARLRISQSALSMQIRQLERTLGHDLFVRANRRLVLTDTGRLVLDYADTIFRTGDELLTVLDRITKEVKWQPINWGKKPNGSGWGIAYTDMGYGAMGAIAVQLTVDAKKKIQIKRVMSVIEIGRAHV